MGNARNRIARVALAAGVGAALALAPATPAAAGDTPVAIAAFAYVSPVVVSPVGGTMSLMNLDGVLGVPHNLVSEGERSPGVPWFSSPTTISPSPVDVDGVSSTPSGVYPFVCTFHFNMAGLLVIV